MSSSVNSVQDEIIEIKKKYNDLTPQDIKDIEELIQKVDYILDIKNIESEKDEVGHNTIVIKSKPNKTRLTSLDIYKFRLNNRNSMRCLALFVTNNNAGGDNIIKYNKDVVNDVVHNNVFTITDLFYSINKKSEFTNQNYVTIDKFPHWFNIKYNNQLNLRELVRYEVGSEGNIDFILNEFNKHLPDNLMLNIFILFIALSDKIATLSMYTPAGSESEYFYKTDSDDMKEVLSLCNQCKKYILNKVNKLLILNSTEVQKESFLVVLNNLAESLSSEESSEVAGSDDIIKQNSSLIVNCFLQAYTEVYYGKQNTNLTNSLDNDFFQHYVVKLTLLVTIIVTLMKLALKQRKKGTSLANMVCGKKPQYDYQKPITDINLAEEEKKRKEIILTKRRATAAKNRLAANDAEKDRTYKNLEKQQLNDLRRTQRAAKERNTDREVKTQEISTDAQDPQNPQESRVRKQGGSIKIVVYLVKIEKIRKLNKKLRKNKSKNKNKIEKNNKLIDELKIKIKKQKEKEKIKKQKEKKIEKYKIKKQKEKLKKKAKKIKKK